MEDHEELIIACINYKVDIVYIDSWVYLSICTPTCDNLHNVHNIIVKRGSWEEKGELIQTESGFWPST